MLCKGKRQTSPPPQLKQHQTVLRVQDCVSDIKDWMTDNKLQLNVDKTKAKLFSSSKLQDAPAPLSICQTVTFSDRVRNLGFYLYKDLTMKQRINFICKTAFFQLRRISTLRQYLTVDDTKTLVVTLVLSRIDCCNSLLAGLPLSSISKLQRVQNCAARLVVRASPNVHITPIPAQLHWLPVQARISYTIACLCFSSLTPLLPFISLISFISILLLDLFVPC